jgi:uncharacterized damage-inducible protein DinB
MTPPSPVRTALRAHLAVIRQGITLLGALGEARYTARVPLCYDASIGGHLRHIIEHYRSFLHGLDAGEIDYENRPRDALIEQNAGHAAGVLAEIADRLHSLEGTLAERGVRVAAEVAPGTATTSSVLRELEFLLSHTVHHYALVAVMARLQGCEPEATFGVAPSTLRYRENHAAACAR